MTANVGTVVVAPIVPNDSADTYPTHFDYYGFGGYASVATFADLAAIPSFRRTGGMQRYVQDTGLVYVLAADLTTWNGFDPANAAAAAAAAEAAAAAAEAAAEAAEAISLSVKFAPTRPDLLALPIPTAPTVVKLGTFNNVLAAGDFIWNPTSTATVVPGMCETLTAQAPGAVGRFIRTLMGAIVSACMTGAYADNVHDDTVAIQAGSDQANMNSAEFALDGGTYFTTNIVTPTGPIWGGRGGTDSSSGVESPPTLRFVPADPTDLAAAIGCYEAIGSYVRNVQVVGPVVYTLATVQSQGYIDPTQVTTAVNNSGGLILKYSAFSPGPAGVLTSVTSKTLFENVSTKGLKVGFHNNSTNGHIFYKSCRWGGLIGIYYSNDSGDYYEELCEDQGIFSARLFTDSAPVGNLGGILNLTQNRCHNGFGPYCFNQVQSGTTAVGIPLGIDLTSTGSSMEAIGEAFLNCLPNAVNALRFYGVACGTASFNTSTQLPSSLLATNLTQMYFMRCGLLNQLYWLPSTGGGGTGLMPISSYALAHNPSPAKVASVYLDGYGNQWCSSVLSSLDGATSAYIQTPFQQYYPKNSNSNVTQFGDIKYAYKSDAGVRRDFRPSRNLFKQPSYYNLTLGLGVADNCRTTNGGSWFVNGAGATITMDKLSNWIAAGEFSASVVPPQMYAFGGDDMMVVKFLPGGTGQAAELNCIAGLAASPNRIGVMGFFCFSPQVGNVTTRLQDSIGGFLGLRTLTQNASSFIECFYPNLPLDANPPAYLLIAPAVAIPVYIALPMLTYGGERSPYFGRNTPGSDDGLSAEKGFFADYIAGVPPSGSTGATIVAQAGAGTGPTISVSGNAIAGVITLLTGTSPAASATVATVTLGATLLDAQGNARIPVINLTPRNTAANRLTGVANVCVTTVNNTAFNFSSDTTPLAAATTYQWNYHAIA